MPERVRMVSRSRTIYLSGFSGCGKSTIGPLLAARLKAPFVDTDEMIERQTGCSIQEMFAKKGERHFRRVEAEVIKLLDRRRGQRRVIALGGGALINKRTRQLVATGGMTVFLSCSVRELYRRLKDKKGRPLLNVGARHGIVGRDAKLRRIQRLLHERLPVYRLADVCISTTDRSPRRTVEELLRVIAGLNDYH